MFQDKFSEHLDVHDDDCLSSDDTCMSDDDDGCSGSLGWEVKVHPVEHVWFYKWADFGVPSSPFLEVVPFILSRNVCFCDCSLPSLCYFTGCRYTCKSNSHSAA